MLRRSLLYLIRYSDPTDNYCTWLTRAQPSAQDMPSFFLRSSTEAVDLLCLFFDVLTQSTIPPVSSQPLYADLAHRLSRLMQSVFDSCLSNKDAMVSETQATHLIRICSATKLFMGVQRTSIQRKVYAEMLSRLLLHRLSSQYSSVEDDMLRTLLVEHLEPQERSVSASNLTIVSSIAQMGNDDESGTVSASRAHSEYPLCANSRNKEFGDVIHLSHHSASWRRSAECCQNSFVLRCLP
jgi:hypothetical protein